MKQDKYNWEEKIRQEWDSDELIEVIAKLLSNERKRIIDSLPEEKCIHSPCHCAGRPECHECGQPFSEEYLVEELKERNLKAEGYNECLKEIKSKLEGK